MNSVQAFVTNIVFPHDYDEWEYRFLNGVRYDLEDVLDSDYEEWTVPRWCKLDDIVFFMFAKTSSQSVAHLRAVYKNERRQTYDQETQRRVEDELTRLQGLCDRYAGKIFATAKVSGNVFYDDDPEVFRKHWGNNLYAGMDEVWKLERPVDISEFKPFLQISNRGAITAVVGEAFRELKALIKRHNNIPRYLEESDATPMPLMRINRDNWLEINNEHRHSYFLEIQFRHYYVDYMLPLLGDIKRFWSECTCVSDISNNARVDNVIWFYGKYLPVEIKLSASSQKDLPGQCRKYCHLKTMELDWVVDGSECYEDHVLVIDTDCVYLYTFGDHLVRPMKMLDAFKAPSDIKTFREELSRLLPIGEVTRRRRRSAAERTREE